MIVYMNRKPVSGPWGGGSKILGSIISALHTSGIDVVFEWNNERHYDIIYCHDPRPNDDGIWYQHFLDRKQKDGTPIVQRVGDVGTHGKPGLTELVKQTISFSDRVIFPSKWARDYVGYHHSNAFIIPNAPLGSFYTNRNTRCTLSKPLRVVTHHWSTNPKKGFALYGELAQHLNKLELEIDFVYAGRFNSNIPIHGISILDPMGIDELSSFLPQHDIYLTASIEEAGANHVLEAMASGLPVLYAQNGGSIAEYCHGYGLEYVGCEDLIEKIQEIKSDYGSYKRAVCKFNRSIDDMSRSYLEVFSSVTSNASYE